jgi:hypothetical protein
MPFEPGHKIKGGRPKGSKNKDIIPLEAKAQELQVDPFEILLLFAQGNWQKLGYDGVKAVNGEYTINPSVRAKAASEACQYLYCKRKAIEHDVGPNAQELIDKCTLVKAS